MQKYKDKICMGVILLATIINVLYAYRTNRGIELQLEHVIFTHNNTPSKSIDRIKKIEARLDKIELWSRIHRGRKHEH